MEGKIEAVTQPKEWEGRLQIGFKIENTWYNVQGTEEDLKVVQEFVKKGNVISFDYDSGTKGVSDIKVISEGKESNGWVDDIVNFETLLTAAHNKKELFSIKTEMLAIDLENKYALFKARIIVSNGEIIDNERTFQVFEAHGDATSENITGDFIKPHFIRMAETRAIVRALRWYTNSAVAEEEKGDKKKKPVKASPNQYGAEVVKP